MFLIVVAAGQVFLIVSSHLLKDFLQQRWHEFCEKPDKVKK
jgi:hypothetical protein